MREGLPGRATGLPHCCPRMLRRSPRITHFCSVRLTHTKNTIWRSARRETSDIIHAKGVRGAFPSSAPKARNALRSQDKLRVPAKRPTAGSGRASPAQHLPCGKNTLLPGGKTPPNWPWWWVTFGEQSMVISPECRSEEAEEALSGQIVDLDYRVTEDGQERWTAMGLSTAGRLLVIVWTVLDDGSYRPITAYPATKGLESVYHSAIQGTGTERFEGTE